MELGAFSVSLTVEDLEASRAFYTKLGFEAAGGDETSWVIMVNGSTVIGLFQGMFERNMLTFNPGWSGPGEAPDVFTDVRELRVELAAQGVEIIDDHTGDTDSGPAHFMVVDPDGNPILVDQHR
jgi:catechol 2,3-dioxygenase-like lactoylglutathione lyase family enzyme